MFRSIYHVKAPRFWLGPSLLIVVSSVFFFLSIRWGIGVRPDSVYYLGLPGIVHTNAPAYAWLLDIVAAIGAPFGISKLSGAALVNFALLLSNVCLVWWVIFKGTGRNSLALLGALLCLSAPMFIDLHVTVLSEALFILCMLVSLLSLARYVESGPFGLAAMAGLAAGLATLTRFNGAPLIVLGPLAITFLASRPFLIRARDSLLFLVSSVGVLGVWLFLQQSAGGSGLGREMALNGSLTKAVLNQGVSSLLSYLVPLSIAPSFARPLALAALAIVVVIATAIYFQRWTERRRMEIKSLPFESLPLIAVIFVLGHLTFLVLSLFIEANLPLKPSYMLPVYVVGVVAGALLAGGGASFDFGKPVRHALIAFSLALLAMNLIRTGVLITEFRRDGIFYASPSWQNSPTIVKVAEIDSELEVYSNGADVLSFLLPERPVNWVPPKFNRRTGKDWANDPFEGRLGVLRKKLAEGKAVVVFLDKIEWRFYMPTEKNLVEALNLVPLARESDGTIYVSGNAGDTELKAHKNGERGRSDG